MIKAHISNNELSGPKHGRTIPQSGWVGHARFFKPHSIKIAQ